jgi:hypothetical protein
MNNETNKTDSEAADLEYAEFINDCKEIADEAGVRGMLQTYLSGEDFDDLPLLLTGLIEIALEARERYDKLEEAGYPAICACCAVRQVVYGDILDDDDDEAATMTPEHAQWKEFLTELSQSIREHGCDAKSLRLAKDILSSDRYHCDVEASLEFFREHGGYCDCEILLNVTDAWENEEEEEEEDETTYACFADERIAKELEAAGAAAAEV